MARPRHTDASQGHRELAPCLVMAGIAALIPVVFPPTIVSEAITVMIALIAALALQLLTGLAGQFSLGSAALMAIGAFTAGWMLARWPDAPFWSTLLVAAAVTAVVGMIVGLPAIRLRGLYLIVATLALHYIILFLLQHYQTENVGPVGYVVFRPEPIADEMRWFYFLLVIALAVTFLVAGYRVSRAGSAMMMVNHNEFAAEAIGINSRRLKLFAFVLSSAITGFLGALTAYSLGVVTYQAFTLDSALMYVAIIIIAGLGSAWATWIGAAFIIWLPTLTTRFMDAVAGQDAAAQNVQLGSMVYGLLIVGFMMFVPGGINGVFASAWRRLRLLGKSNDPDAVRGGAEVHESGTAHVA